jgi:N-acetylmuramoyl-L-alanine amidase
LYVDEQTDYIACGETMKFGIDSGHNCPPHDTGAVGGGTIVEDKLTLAVGNALKSKLVAAGHSIVNCTPSSASSVGDSLRKRVDKANSNNVDIFVSIHFNKHLDGSSTTSKAMGSEIHTLSNAGAGIAAPVLKNIVALGFKNRDVRSTSLYVLRNTSMPAILIEVCFLDSNVDMVLFNSLGADAIAQAISDGLIGKHQSQATPQPGNLTVTQATLLKPSTDQSSNIPAGECVNINPGTYPVLDFGFEERHWWVKWPDSSQANRDNHFIFEDFGRVD